MPEEPNVPPTNKPKFVKGALATLSLLLFTVLMLVLPWKLQNYGQGQNYIAVLVMMILFIVVLGYWISGRPDGILINQRNLFSLSRFQMVLWTVIILGGYLTAVIGRLKTGSNPADALNLGLDRSLWGLLGISTASLIGSPLLQSPKTAQTASDKAINNTAATMEGQGTPESAVTIKANAQGVLYVNASIQDAAISDMFEGDEVGNTAYVDVAKVQMFFFTIVGALAYGIELNQWIAQQLYRSDITLPTVATGMVALLGISHAGFLANRSTTQTPPK